MKKPILALALILIATPAQACNEALHLALDMPVPEAAELYVDVADVQSTEGGEWKVWLAPDGKAREVVRIDYGEMGRLMTRLVVTAPDAYAVTATRSFYSTPIYLEGADTIREEKDIYFFCNGALQVPEEDFGMVEGYGPAAAEALARFSAAEIAQYLPQMQRRD